MLSNWDNTSAGSWCSAAMFTLSEWPVSLESYCRIPSHSQPFLQCTRMSAGASYSIGWHWFMTKFHVLRIACWSDVNSSIGGWFQTLGPNGHGKKPPSSRLGTLYSYYRQWFMAKIHVFSLVLFVRHQFQLCITPTRAGSIRKWLAEDGSVGKH